MSRPGLDAAGNGRSRALRPICDMIDPETDDILYTHDWLTGAAQLQDMIAMQGGVGSLLPGIRGMLARRRAFWPHPFLSDEAESEQRKSVHRCQH